MQKTYVLFKSIKTGAVFLWNGLYPINVNHFEIPSNWNPNGEDISKEEQTLFKTLEEDKRKTFRIKDRGSFTVLSRTTNT